MNLIGKICVLFLVWTMFGAIAYFKVIMKYCWKVWKLEAGREECIDEFFEEVFDAVKGTYIKEDADYCKGFGDYFTTFFLVGIVWPYVLGQAIPACEKAYEAMCEKHMT